MGRARDQIVVLCCAAVTIATAQPLRIAEPIFFAQPLAAARLTARIGHPDDMPASDVPFDRLFTSCLLQPKDVDASDKRGHDES
jgi:hypothetical protein